MRFLKKQQHKLLVGFCLALLCASIALAQASGAEILNLKASRLGSDLAVSAEIKFDLPNSIEGAMYKGVSLTFVSDLEIAKERWYWADKTVVVASRQTRISYQALTRRWRVLPWSEGGIASGLGVQIPQTYESLAEALSVAQRIYNWRVANEATVEDGNYWIQLSYRLDISQLPKPLQIGLLGQGDWRINAALRQRVYLTKATP